MLPKVPTRRGVVIASSVVLLVLIISATLLINHFGPLAGAAPQPDSSQSFLQAHKKKTPVPTKTPLPQATPTPSPTSGSLQVFVEPAAGEQPMLNAINNAQKSVWMEMYLLTDTNIIQALENAAKRHLDVRVMLEPNPVGGGSPQSTLNALQAAGASVEDTSPAFTLTHEKGLIIDGQTALIMSCNLTYSALNGKNREYGVIDSVPQDVQETSAIFTSDWNRTTPQLTDPSLVVSPVNARTDLTTLINGAHTSLIIEAEELEDSGIEQAIAGAAQRCVQVQVILPTPASQPDPNSAGISTIKAAGAQVKQDAQLYMHAKMVEVDGTAGFVGSENFSTASLDGNRELGVLLSNASILATLQQTFQQDWSISQSA